MTSWLANLTQAVQDRLESLVDDGAEPQEVAPRQEDESGLADAMDVAVGMSQGNTPVSMTTDGADDLVTQLEEQKALIDALKALVREKESKNFEQEQLIKEMQAMQMPDLESRNAELERTIEDLRIVMRAKEEFLQGMQEQQARLADRQPAATELRDSANVDELMRSILKKDNAIFGLQDRIQELEQKMMDLQELASEKDEVLHGRDKAIKVLQEQLAARDSALKQSSDGYAALKAEFTSFQEWFAAQEGAWSGRLTEYQNAYALAAGQVEQARRQLLDVETQHAGDISDRDAVIAQLKATVAEQRVQQLTDSAAVVAAKPLAAAAAADEGAVAGRVDAASGSGSVCSDDPRDKELAELKKSLHEQSTKMLKMKAQALAKVKALQKELEDAKQAIPSAALSAEVHDLHNRIAEIEEEKGNLQLQLVDMDEVKTTCAKLSLELEATVASLRQAQLESGDLAKTLEDQRQAFAFSEEASRAVQAQHVAEVTLLRSELQKLQQHYDSAAAELAAERERSNLFSVELRRAKDEMQQYQALSGAETASLVTRLNHIEALLTAATEAKVTAELRMAELEETRDALLKDRAELATAVSNLERQLEQQHEHAASVAATRASDDPRTLSVVCEPDALLQRTHAQQQYVQPLQSEISVDRAATYCSESPKVEREEEDAGSSFVGEAARKPLEPDASTEGIQHDAKAAVNDLRPLNADALQVMQTELQRRHEEQIVDLMQQHTESLTAMQTELQRRHEEQMVGQRQQHAGALETVQVQLQQHHEEQIVDLRQHHTADLAMMQTELQRRHEEQIAELRQEHDRTLGDVRAELQQRHEEQTVDLRQQHTAALAAMQTELQRRHEEQIADLQQQHACALEAVQAELQQRHEQQTVDLQQQHNAAVAAMQTELQQRYVQQTVDLRQQHTEALAAIQSELQRCYEEQIVDLRQQHADAISLNAKYRADLASHADAVAAAELQRNDAVVALQKELCEANSRAAALEQEAAAAVRQADSSASSWLKHCAELEQQLAAYKESQSMLADQLHVLIDERSCVDASAARDRQEHERASTLACSRLFRIAADSRLYLPEGLLIKQPATVEEAVLLSESTISALQEKLQATEDRLSSLLQEQSAQAAEERADDSLAKLPMLPPSLIAKASALLPKESQLTADAAATDWFACLLDALVEWRAREETVAAELKASTVRHAEKIASLASNLQEVDSQLTASASEAESLRAELSVCRQQLTCTEATLLQQQSAASHQQSSATEHEANLRKYAAAIKKLKADIALKEKEVAAANDQSIRLGEQLRKLLLHCRATATSATTGLRLDGGGSNSAAAAFGRDDSGLDVSLSTLPHDLSLASATVTGETPSSLSVDACIELLQQLFDSISAEAVARCSAADDSVSDLRRLLSHRDAELQVLKLSLDELEATQRRAAAATDEAARLSGELDTVRAQCEQLQLSAREAAAVADRRLLAAEAERDSQVAANRARTDKMLAKLRQLKERGDELQARLDAAEARANAAESTAAAAAAARQHLEERCVAAERDAAAVAGAAAEASAMRAELDRLRAAGIAAAAADVEVHRAAAQQHAAEAAVLLERTERAVAAQAAAEAEAALLRSKLDDSLRRQATAEAETAEVRSQVDDALCRQASAEADVSQLRSQLDDVLRRLTSAEAEASETRAKVADALRRQAAAEAEAAVMHTKVDNALRQQSSAEADTSEMRLQVDDALRRQAAAEAEAAEMHAKVDDALRRQAAAEAQAAEMRSKVDEALAAQAAAATEASRALANAREELQGNVAAAETEAARLRLRVEELSKAAERQSAQQLVMLEAARREATEALADERRRLGAALDAEHSQAQRDRSLLEQRLAEAESAAKRAQLDAEVERSSAAEQCQSLERRLAEAQRQYSMLEADHREFERVAATLREAKVRLEREAHDLRRRLAASSAIVTQSATQSTVEREVVQPLGSTADSRTMTTTTSEQKQHGSDVAFSRSDDSRPGGRPPEAQMSVTVVEQLKALCTIVASAPAPARDSPTRPFAADDVGACVGFLHDRVTQLLAEASRWQAEQAELLARHQASGVELQRRDRDCQQLAAKVQELSQSLLGLSQQHSQAMADLQHATLELQRLQVLQDQRQCDHSSSHDQAVLATRVSELEASCQRLQKDLDDARRRESESILSASGGASGREHSVYIEDADANGATASDELSLTAGSVSEQLPLLQRAGRFVEQGVPLLRAITKRQASRFRRLLRSQPRPQLLLLAYAFLLHVLVFGACFGNWFCP